ncbi:MAG: DUF3857 domain-containing protein [Planctomycetes bacterium]|nr:DUF3857 domain-containing protein [Planctomycetota bacterium]
MDQPRLLRAPARFLLLAAALLTGHAIAQGLTPAERELLAAKGRGDYPAAIEAALRAIPEQGDALAAARAEYALGLAAVMAQRIGPDPDLARRLEALAQHPLARAHPGFADAVDMVLLAGAWRRGDAARGRALGQRCGMIGSFALLGPFDNERGAGYARALPPDQGVEVAASYEGKKRPVRWRVVPVQDPPRGIFDLSALLEPDQQVLAYAACALRSERAQEVVLHLGCSDSFRVFLDGGEVAAREVRRPFAHDQDAIVLPLRAGSNLLVLKLCVQESGFAFAARLRTRSGGPVQGVETRADEAALQAATARLAAEPRGAAPPAAPPRGPLDLLAESAAGGDAADALRLAQLLALRTPDDPNDRRDHRLALAAAQGLPDEPAARFLLAYTRVRPVRHAAEKDENARRHDYEAILARHPDHCETLRALGEMDLEGLGAAERAAALARRALAVNPAYTQARLLLADALERRGMAALAHRERTQAATAPRAGADALRAATRERRQGPDAQYWRPFVAAALAQEWNQDNLLALVDTDLWLLRREPAMALLRQGIAALPFARELPLRLATLLAAERAHAEAALVLQAWLAIAPEDDGALLQLADLRGHMGERDARLETLRLALDLNPNLKDTRRQLEYLESETRPFYHGLQVAFADVVKDDPGPPADAAAANDPFHYLFDQRVVRAYRNGTTSTYRHFVVRILNEAGQRRFARWTMPHFREEQRARILDVRVLKADGTTQRPRLAGAAVELPPLAAGDVVEIQARVDDLAPTFFGDYFGLEHRFVPAEGVPCRRAALVLLLEPGREYRFQTRNGAPEGTRATLADGTLQVAYELRDLPRRVTEEQRPEPFETEPLVRVTTFQDWDAFAAWWWSLIRKQMDASPAIRAKVAELTAGATSELARIEALYRFVTTEIRYTAWEFGVHGYKPYSTSVIYERRHGDCKDKALLLNVMLELAGVRAWPVLIRAEPLRSADDLTLPLVHHFNHCISYVPAQGDRQALFLDGTAIYHPLDTLPEMDQGATVLVVEDGRGVVRPIPWSEADANLDTETVVVNLDERGNATIGWRREPRGTAAVGVREALGSEPSRRKEILERALADSLGKVELRTLDTSDLLEPGQPVRLGAEGTVRDFAAREGEALLLRVALGESGLASGVRAPGRQLALLLGVPEAEAQTLRYRLPAGFAAQQVPAPVQVRTRFVDYDLKVGAGEGEVLVERRLVRKAQRVEPQEYAEYREVIQRIEEADRTTVVVRKGGAR